MKKIFLFFLLSALSVVSVKADITYNPLYVVIYAPNGNGFASMNITNPTNSPVRMQLGILEWEFTPENEIKILERDPGKESIADYIKISPKQFTLPPMQKKVVRIACNLPASYEENKEYKLLFNMTEIGADRKVFEGPGSEGGKASYGLIINKAVNAGTYIRKGQAAAFKAIIDYKDLSAKLSNGQVKYQFKYQNTGNIHGRREIGVKFYKGDKLVYEKPGVGGLIIFPNPEAPKTLQADFDFPKDKLDENEKYDVEFVIKDDSLEALTGKADKPYSSGRIALIKE